jgi:lipopolysaccharide/colanic/teichoic acid biosynthesis glycosyltransferase
VILSVRPGITDYASIRFRHLDEELGSVDVDRVYAETVRPVKNRLRISYVERQSFLEDLKLIGLTVARIVRR